VNGRFVGLPVEYFKAWVYSFLSGSSIGDKTNIRFIPIQFRFLTRSELVGLQSDIEVFLSFLVDKVNCEYITSHLK
jgi:hypothetical protein